MSKLECCDTVISLILSVLKPPAFVAYQQMESSGTLQKEHFILCTLSMLLCMYYHYIVEIDIFFQFLSVQYSCRNALKVAVASKLIRFRWRSNEISAAELAGNFVLNVL